MNSTSNAPSSENGTTDRAVPTVRVCHVCGASFASGAALAAHYRGAGLLD